MTTFTPTKLHIQILQKLRQNNRLSVAGFILSAEQSYTRSEVLKALQELAEQDKVTFADPLWVAL